MPEKCAQIHDFHRAHPVPDTCFHHLHNSISNSESSFAISPRIALTVRYQNAADYKADQRKWRTIIQAYLYLVRLILTSGNMQAQR